MTNQPKVCCLKQPPFIVAHKSADQLKHSVDVGQALISNGLLHEFVGWGWLVWDGLS